MSRYGIWPHFKSEFECQNTILGLSFDIKIGFRMSKYDIQTQFECKNGILNVKIQYSASVFMSK